MPDEHPMMTLVLKRMGELEHKMHFYERQVGMWLELTPLIVALWNQLVAKAEKDGTQVAESDHESFRRFNVAMLDILRDFPRGSEPWKDDLKEDF